MRPNFLGIIVAILAIILAIKFILGFFKTIITIGFLLLVVAAVLWFLDQRRKPAR